jgi:hypothetical protein
MNRNVPAGVAIAIVAAVVVGGVLALVLTGWSGSQSAQLSMSREKLLATASSAMSRTHGDTSKMTADEKAAYEEALKHGLINNPYRSPLLRGRARGGPGAADAPP